MKALVRRALTVVATALKREGEDLSCLTYAPWSGHFGCHICDFTGQVFRTWSNHPFNIYSTYVRAKKDRNTKAIFLYIRLSPVRSASVIAYYINRKPNPDIPGIRSGDGNASRNA